MNDLNRVLDVAIPEHWVLDGFMSMGKDLPSCLCIPVLKGLPDGYRLMAVWYDFHSRLFYFRVQHESFEPVADGQQIPAFQEEITRSIIVLQLTLEQRQIAEPAVKAQEDCDTPIILERL